MIWGLFALTLIFGIVSAVAFLRSGATDHPEESEAHEFAIEEHNEYLPADRQEKL